MQRHADILTLSPKGPSLFTICQKNNCYRSTILLFGLARTIDSPKMRYNSCIIELFCLTDPFYTKKKVNTMHNECIMEFICSFVQESQKNEVEAMYNSCIIKPFCLAAPFCTKNKVSTVH